METNYSSLGNQAFGADADALIIIKYRSHQDALGFLQSALRQPNGIALLHGPGGSGKSITVRELATQLSHDTDVAFVDGTHLKPHGLLTKILSQYGYESKAETDEQLLKVVNEITTRQMRSWQPPILIVDNVDRMYPSTLRILNTLAAQTVQQCFTMRFVLTGHEGVQALINSCGMRSIAQRSPATYSMSPLTARETMIYLHARLHAAGSERADTVFPFDVCDRLREQSDGWPGTLNKYALDVIKRSSAFPVSVVNAYAPGDVMDQQPVIPVLGAREAVTRLPPRLRITRDGDMLTEYAFKEKKVLIGRSDFADIVIEDDFVSKVHAVLLLYSDALVLLDLNSANGTTVNSVRVSKTILKNDDVISLGHHRLKVENVPEVSQEMAELPQSPDTHQDAKPRRYATTSGA